MTGNTTGICYVGDKFYLRPFGGYNYIMGVDVSLEGTLLKLNVTKDVYYELDRAWVTEFVITVM